MNRLHDARHWESRSQSDPVFIRGAGSPGTAFRLEDDDLDEDADDEDEFEDEDGDEDEDEEDDEDVPETWQV